MSVQAFMRAGGFMLLAGWTVVNAGTVAFAQMAPRPPEFPAKGMVTLVERMPTVRS